MSKQNLTAVVERLKERAQAAPWVPLEVPSQEHYHRFANGLSICFTLDILTEARYWHLSLARIPGGPTAEELEFWRRAFFSEEPDIELPSQIAGLPSRHFHWRA